MRSITGIKLNLKYAFLGNLKKVLFLIAILHAMQACARNAGSDSESKTISGGSASDFGATSKSVTVTPTAGAHLTLGNMQLAIPAGAVDADTLITAQIDDSITLPSDKQQIGKAIKFEPEGLQFLVLPELRICYEHGAIADENSALIYYNSPEGELVAISGSVNQAAHCVSARIEHFSSYIAAAHVQVAGNALPAIGGANFLPTTPMAGLPLRVRTQINDTNGGATPGQVVSAFFYYRAIGSSNFIKAPLIPDDTDSSVTNRYFYLIPANEVTPAGFEYFFEATDNLNAKRTTNVQTRAVPSTANLLRFNPAANLTISSGFMRSLSLQASANGATGPWQNISIENHTLSDAGMGTLTRTGPSTVRFTAQAAGVGTITATAGSLATSINVAVVPGLLSRIAITDANQIELTGPFFVQANQVVELDAVGYDMFGNWSVIRPVFATTGGIGSVVVDISGAHLIAGALPTSGTITAFLSTLTATANVIVYIAPAVVTTSPADGALNVSQNSPIGVVFNKPMDVTTLSASTDETCSGTIQVSANEFASCVPMASSQPQFSAGNTIATITPAALLAGRGVYKVRVVSSVRDSEGYFMTTQYTSAGGFTVEPDLRPPQVVSSVPLPGALAVSYAPSINIHFDHTMHSSSFAAVNFILACNGTPVPVSVLGQSLNTIAGIQPQVHLPAFATCMLTVTTGVQSNEQIAMSAPYILNFATGSAPTATLVREVNIVQPVHGGMFTSANGKVYFAAQVVSLGTELWSTEGTFSSTQQVRDIYAGFGNSSNPDYVTSAGNKVFFVAEDGVHGRELWISDGSNSGTIMVRDIYPGSASSNITGLIFSNGFAYFAADDGVHGQELWKSDGTAAGTIIIKDINSNGASSGPSQITPVNGIIYFSATDSVTGYELWKSDGTEAGTSQVRDINAGPTSSFPKHISAINNTILFSANDGLLGEELWISNGSESGTNIVADIAPGTASSFPEKLTNFSGILYFIAEDGIHGKELWRSDGTQSGSALVVDMKPGIENSYVDKITVGQNGFFLNIIDGTLHQLWFSSGSAVGTQNLGTFDRPLGNSAMFVGRLYFSGFTPAMGSEIWSSNGVAMGTTLSQDIKSGASSSNPEGFYSSGSTLYFRVSDPFSAFPTGLWKFE